MGLTEELEGLLTSGFRALVRRLPSRDELAAFSRYLDLLLKWNRVYSLTTYRKPGEIVRSLFLDSLLFLPLLPAEANRLVDLGAGIGIPGIPVKIAQPERELTLIEARRRRAGFLSAAVRELGLGRTSVLHGRAEQLLEERQDLGGRFDAVLSRAAGRPARIVPLAMKFLRKGGIVVLSGPPVGTRVGLPVPRCETKVLSSPAAGRPRQFFVVEKPS
ncbi:MAG: 16S rRNA (guanine(527)-N(7))-methyltransferase RsmG [Candidatus Methylomirabilia bacterium]